MKGFGHQTSRQRDSVVPAITMNFDFEAFTEGVRDGETRAMAGMELRQTTSSAERPYRGKTSTGIPLPLSSTTTASSNETETRSAFEMCSSIEFDTTSSIMCSSARASVEPTYIAGRRRTAARQSRTSMSSAVCLAVAIGPTHGSNSTTSSNHRDCACDAPDGNVDGYVMEPNAAVPVNTLPAVTPLEPS